MNKGNGTKALLKFEMKRNLFHVHSLSFLYGLFVSFIIVLTGKQESAEATLEALKVVPEPLGKWACILVEVCAYAGKALALFIEQCFFS